MGRSQRHRTLRAVMALATTIGLVVMAACGPKDDDAGGSATAGCDAQVGSGDDSEVAASAAVDSTYGICPVGISRYDVSDIDAAISTIGCWTTPSVTNPNNCLYSGLAALDLTPDGKAFPNPPQPSLTYDLAPNNDFDSPECDRLSRATDGGAECDGEPSVEGQNLKLRIYRLVGTPSNPIKWDMVGSASFITDDLARADAIDHFSVHALVVLPEPRRTDTGIGQTEIGSRFVTVTDGSGAVSVTLRYTDTGERLELDRGGPSLRVTDFEGAIDITQLSDEACQRFDTAAQQLSCQLPIGTVVGIDWDGSTATITGEGGELAEFTTTAVVSY